MELNNNIKNIFLEEINRDKNINEVNNDKNLYIDNKSKTDLNTDKNKIYNKEIFKNEYNEKDFNLIKKIWN